MFVIEVGDEYFSEDSQKLYNAETVGDEILSLSKSRLRQLGGTSGIWGCFKAIRELYFDKWPINNNDLIDYSQSTCEILDIKINLEKHKLINT